MIVVYNALSLRPGVADGAATFSLSLLSHLPGALPDDEIVVLARAAETRLPQAPNLRKEAVVLPSSPGARVLYERFALTRELRRLGAEVLVSPNESIPFRPRCRVVVVAQNLVYHRDGWSHAFQGGRARERLASRVQAAYYRRSMTSAYARATRIAAVSETVVETLSARARLDPAKASVIYEGSDSVLLPPPRSAERKPRLLVVSTLAPYKGLEQTLDLHARLRAEHPELELDVVGGDWRGFRAVLEARAVALGTAGSVRFLGHVVGAQLAEHYDTAQLLIHLSECESFGLPVAEAMRYGLPVVSSGRSSLPEVTKGAALEVGDDLEAATQAVLELLADGHLRDALAARGRERAAVLTWRATAEKMAEVVREAGGDRVSRGEG